jgi:pyruvate dehydrogenase E2 component (dihydrolipoamide acetyltransferase)
MFAPERGPGTAGLDRLAAARRHPGATDRLMEILKSFLVERNGSIGQGTLPLSSFEGFGVPTRLVWGTADTILPVKQVSKIWAGAEVRLIEGVGHMLIDEAPVVVAAAIRATLAEG